MSQLRPGQLAVVTDKSPICSAHHGKVVIGCHDHVMRLDAPGHWWSNPCTVEVRLLPPGTEIKLTVGE